MSSAWTYILSDNGSRRAGSWRSLVRLARKLGEKTGEVIEPVSVLHSDRVAATLPGGPQPRTMRSFLESRLAEGERRFMVVPLFLGPSGAITRYLKELAEELQKDFRDLVVQVAPFLFDASEAENELETILVEHVRKTRSAHDLERPAVVVVDHGSPNPEVTAVRDALARRLGKRLGEEVAGVRPASMERRAGDEFAFNDPLLADCLRQPDLAGTPVILAMLFLSPGRHAGSDGDVDEIVEEARAEVGGLRVYRTPLLGEHPLLVELLHRRFRTAVGPAG